jgi:tRNA nucleotidyltransferase (CCA-adding enzyme)
MRKINYRQAPNWLFTLTECAKISPQVLIAQGYQGEAIKEALHQRRVACVDLILNSWIQHEKQQ